MEILLYFGFVKGELWEHSLSLETRWGLLGPKELISATGKKPICCAYLWPGSAERQPGERFPPLVAAPSFCRCEVWLLLCQDKKGSRLWLSDQGSKVLREKWGKDRLWVGTKRKKKAGYGPVFLKMRWQNFLLNYGTQMPALRQLEDNSPTELWDGGAVLCFMGTGWAGEEEGRASLP